MSIGLLPSSVSDDKQPVCSECKQPWRWPRNIAHMCLVSDVGKTKPGTKSTIVVYLQAYPGTDPPQPVIHDNVFRNLELVRQTGVRCVRPSIKLVDEFHYDNDTGEVFYDTPPPRENMEFGLLVTLSSWYKLLFHVLLSVTFSIMDHQANIVLIAAMILGSDTIWKDFEYSKYVFAIAWSLMMVASFLVAVRAALAERKLKRETENDLPIMTSLYGELHEFIALVFFHFLMVDEFVKNIVIRLHPWKNIQPFAAVKIDGTRAFVVGFRDRHLYKVSRYIGNSWGMAMLHTLKAGVFLFKAYVALALATDPNRSDPSFQLVAACLSSIGSAFMGCKEVVELWFHRSKLYAELDKIVEEGKERCSFERDEGGCKAGECENCSELQRRQCDSAKKLLRQEYLFTKSKYKLSDYSVTGNQCKLCKRNKDMSKDMEEQHRRVTPEIGDRVQLIDKKIHDAKFGCLKTDTNHNGDITVGKVVRVVPKSKAGSVARCLVEVREKQKPEKTKVNLERDYYWTESGAPWALTLTKNTHDPPPRDPPAAQIGLKARPSDQKIELFGASDAPKAGAKVTRKQMAALQSLGETQLDDALTAHYVEVGVKYWYDERALAIVADTLDKEVQTRAPSGSASSIETRLDRSRGWHYDVDPVTGKIRYCYYDAEADTWEIHSDINSIMPGTMDHADGLRLLE